MILAGFAFPPPSYIPNRYPWSRPYRLTAMASISRGLEPRHNDAASVDCAWGSRHPDGWYKGRERPLYAVLPGFKPGSDPRCQTTGSVAGPVLASLVRPEGRPPGRSRQYDRL